MKSYEQALNEIYSKANEQLLQMNKRKKRTQMILLSLSPLCLVLTIALSVGIGSSIGNTTPAPNNDTHDNVLNVEDSSVHETQDNFTANDSITSKDVSDDEIIYEPFEPSIYPGAWRTMNAAIVRWGEQNDQTWRETTYMAEYVGINVEFVKVYSETMSESDVYDVINDIEENLENAVEQTTYLLIPEYHLNEIKAGDTALVFLDVFENWINQDADGTETVTHVMGVRLGKRIEPGKFVPAPIFAVSDGKVLVPDYAYEFDPKYGGYYMWVMDYLHEANEYIRKNSDVQLAVFENGVDVEELADYFAYICGE